MSNKVIGNKPGGRSERRPDYSSYRLRRTMRKLTAERLKNRREGKVDRNCLISDAQAFRPSDHIAKALRDNDDNNKRTPLCKLPPKAEVLEYINNLLFKTGEDKPIVYSIIDGMVEAAIKDPNSAIGMKLAGVIFKDNFLDQIEELHSSYDKKVSKDLDYMMFKLRQTLYDKQQAVWDSLGKKVVIINGRRSGKTELLGRLIVGDLLKPPMKNVVNGKEVTKPRRVAYINRNSSAAIRQIKNPILSALNVVSDYISIARGSIEGQEVTFSNGAQLLIIGNNNAADVDKLRGEALSMVLLDECGHQRNIRQLLREVIEPAMQDYEDSHLIIVGTPPRAPHSYIEEVYNNAEARGWQKWHWTMFENPFIPNRDNIIKEICTENGVTIDSSFIRREYYGEMGVYDEDSKVIKSYRYDDDDNNGKELVGYVGVDWGFEDKAAVVASIGWKKHTNNYEAGSKVVWCWSDSNKTITDIVNKVKEALAYIKTEYHLTRAPIVICDNNEKSAVAELYYEHHIPNVATAYKYDLAFGLNQLNDYLSTGKITIDSRLKGSELIVDFDNTIYERDEETDAIKYGTIDDTVHHPNSMMALLYISRQIALELFGKDTHNKSATMINNAEKAKEVTGYAPAELLPQLKEEIR